MIKISIITATFNSADTIESCLDSIASQTYKNIEHIVIDGNSRDDTLKIINTHTYNPSLIISETDKGIYDALNKGFYFATGDLIGILHSDDKLSDQYTIANIARVFDSHNVDYIYGDLKFVNESDKVIRIDRTGIFKNNKIITKQIPHPTLYISKKIINQLDPIFDTSYEISADLKQQLLISHKLNAKGFYIPEIIVIQKSGGRSTRNLKAYIHGWIESMRAWNEVNKYGGLFFVISKVFSKIKGVSIKLWK